MIKRKGGEERIMKIIIFSDFFLAQSIPIVSILVGILLQFVKRNLWIGLRTSTTLSDPEIWEKSNKVTGVILLILGILFFFLNLIAYYLDWKLWFKELDLVLVSESIIILGVGIFGVIYSNKLKQEKETTIKLKPFIISRAFVYVICFVSVLTVITGLLLPFIPPNFYIGIRIGKTFSDPAIWKTVNTVSGIGFIVIGIIFTPLFFSIARKEDTQRTKLFEKNLVLFVVLNLIWALLSVGFAYLV